jgi:acetolactate synthase-1/2/3 large subunit
MTSVGALPSNDRHLVGLLGIHESSAAHQAMRHADLIICVGARFDERSYDRLGDPARDPGLIHIDIDPATINKVMKADGPLVGDCGEILLGLERRLLSMDLHRGRLDAWWRQFDAWAAVESTEVQHDREGGVTARQLMLAMRDPLASREAAVAADHGEYRSLAALLLRHAGPRRWLVSGGSAVPGFALPAAIGAAVADPGKVIVCITDEASLLATIQELHTVARNGWPIKLFVLASRDSGFRMPAMLAVAKSFGWPANSVDYLPRLERAVQECLVSPGPALLEVVTAHSRLSPELSATVHVREVRACERATN